METIDKIMSAEPGYSVLIPYEADGCFFEEAVIAWLINVTREDVYGIRPYSLPITDAWEQAHWDNPSQIYLKLPNGTVRDNDGKLWANIDEWFKAMKAKWGAA